MIDNEIKSTLRRLDPAFRRGVHILYCDSPYMTKSFLCAISHLTPNGTIACYTPILDILGAEILRYECPTGKRTFCMFVNSPQDWISRETLLTAAIHEGAHYLEDKSPSRDEPDEKKALRQWWGRWESSELQHDPRWLRAASHLWFRAAAIGGVIIPVEGLLSQYAPASAIVGALRPEFQRTGERIEDILETPPPGAFTRICDLWFDGTLPKPSPSPACKATRRPRAFMQWMRGRLVETLQGKTTIDGRPVSEQAFRTFIRCNRETLNLLWPKTPWADVS